VVLDPKDCKFISGYKPVRKKMAGKKHQAVNSFNLPEVVGMRRGVASELGATGPTKSDSVLMMGSY